MVFVKQIIWLVMCSVIVQLSSTWSLPKISDYTDHPCRRDCLGAHPMKCEYDFIVEHYQTMSRACYDCPHNGTDCDRPHCIPGDGFLRAIKVVNRMMPGPAIHVCKDDEVIVNVHNELSDFEGTSIHWHGVLQEGTPHMDGVSMVTQCPIPVHSAFQYRFLAKNAGTHYWHAHSGLQRGDGIYGALVIRETSETSVMRYYDDDFPEHTIIYQDWLDQYSSSKFSLHHHGMSDNLPSSILINGRATAFGVAKHEMDMDMDMETHVMKEDDKMEEHMGMTMKTTTKMPDHSNMNMGMTDGPMGNMTHDMPKMAHVPHTVYTVSLNRRYRLRFISNGLLNCPLKISVESHILTVIASDGYDIDPVKVDSLTIFAGERYDVVLTANQKPGNYWMHVVGLGDCEQKNTSQTAILRYRGVMPMLPTTGANYSDGDIQGINGNPMRDIKPEHVTVAEMTSDKTPEDVYTSHNVKKFYMNLGYNEVENPRFLDPDHYPLSAMTAKHGAHGNHLYALQMNYITFKMPNSPVLSQLGDLGEEIFCNETHTPVNCKDEICECVHRLKVDLGDVVELVLVSNGIHGIGYHPMHLHGHTFYVLGLEKLNTTITRATIENLDKRGMLKRNLVNPIKKDTVMVPDGGYTIIRFKAINPGFWLFHCHVDFHFALGMSIVLQVGETTDMTSTPHNFPRCGNWHFSQETPDYYANMCARYSSGANTLFSQSTTLLVLMMVVLFRTFTQ